ncbi:hypothetical protein [Bdellovibrio sp. KM01]|uniref:hypothetical protein n=1 Tax=Bdellovibrio sp. KM01 TaxID=2748865 RepID=UPI0015EA702C|nr:hypothetical protein [Bdellovibrio sp. KM01]QLY24500.1 hypothetical protein HW988_13680 [Bdellovibrio sp. KM01]
MKSNTIKSLFLSVLMLAAASVVGCAGHEASDDGKPRLYTQGNELHLTRLEAYASASIDFSASRFWENSADIEGSFKDVKFLQSEVQSAEFKLVGWYEIITNLPGCPARSAGFSNPQSDNTYSFSITFEDSKRIANSCVPIAGVFAYPIRIKLAPTPITLADGRKAIADSVTLYINYRDSDLK